MSLKNKELLQVIGGAVTINATFINALSRAFTTIIKIGQTIGTVIRRSLVRDYC